MKAQCIVPKHQLLDYEISQAYKDKIAATVMTYQLVPPNDHHRKIAEKAVQTLKHHFIGILSDAAATFPLHLWCQEIPQAKHQLLMLRQLNLFPKISVAGAWPGEFLGTIGVVERWRRRH